MNRIMKLLYQSLEGNLKEKQGKKLENKLALSPKLFQEKKRSEQIRKNMTKNSAAVSFTPGFAERVLERWDRVRKNAGQNGFESLEKYFKSLFLRVAFAGTIILILLISYHLFIGANFSWEETYYATDAAVEELQQLALF